MSLACFVLIGEKKEAAFYKRPRPLSYGYDPKTLNVDRSLAQRPDKGASILEAAF